MDTNTHSLRVPMVQHELVFPNLENKEKTVLFTISNDDNKTLKVVFTNGNRVTI